MFESFIINFNVRDINNQEHKGKKLNLKIAKRNI